VADSHGVYHQARAIIEETTIVVMSEAVPNPVAVRFAWHEQAEPNLVNAAGLPAVPFRSARR